MDNAKKLDLKNQALTQRIASLVAQYEDQLADMRAEATIQIETLSQENDRLNARITELEGANEVSEEADASNEG